jgi:hypothetical protein
MAWLPPDFTVFTLYLGRTPSYDYIREQFTAQGLELVVAYGEYGELSYKRDRAWGVEVENGIERTLTSRESAHMRWAENMMPGRPFQVLPNDVTRWLWQELSLASLRATQQVPREAIRSDPNHYEVVRFEGMEELVWEDNQGRRTSVRILVPWWHHPLGGVLSPYQLFEARPCWETHPDYVPLVFSVRTRQWVMTGHPDAEFVGVPPGAVNWLLRQVRTFHNIYH